MPRATDSPGRLSPPLAKPSFGQAAVHVFGLTALVVATPICDLAHRFPEFLWAHELSFPGIVAVVLCLILLPPLPLVPLVAAAHWGAGSRASGANGIAIALPVFVLALQTAVRVGLGGWSVLIGAAALGGLAGTAYLRWRTARAVATVLSVVALFAPAQLLLGIPRGSGIDSGESPIARPVTSTPVVFVIFDELPMVSLLADGARWDRRNFPNFERLASTSHTFLNAHSISAGTLVAVPAILTGSRPAPRQAPTHANFPRNLFTLLGGTHQIFASEPATELCPEKLNLFAASPAQGNGARRLVSDLWILLQTVSVPSPWSDDLPPIDVAWRDFAGAGPPSSVVTESERDLRERYQDLRTAGRDAGAGRGAEFRRFVASIDSSRGASAAPTLHFIHTMLPHGPWLFQASGRAYTSADRSRAAGRAKTWSLEAPEMVALGYQRHLLQARYADRLLGELLDRLEATGRFDSSLVVVTADHGASFRPGQAPREDANPAEALWTPLLIKAPGQAEGRIHTAPLTSLDVLPTVLDVLGAKPPWPLEGATALSALAGEGALPDVSEAISWKTSVFGDDLDFEPPLRTNPHARLIGLETSSFPAAGAGGVELIKLEPGPVLHYDPAAGYAPLLVAGSLRRGRKRRGCCDLAFAVNDRIVAVQHTYAAASELYRRFQVLLPESALEPGANELSIHAIRDSGRGVRLARLPLGG